MFVPSIKSFHYFIYGVLFVCETIDFPYIVLSVKLLNLQAYQLNSRFSFHSIEKKTQSFDIYRAKSVWMDSGVGWPCRSHNQVAVVNSKLTVVVLILKRHPHFIDL
jgi:hypothetical protein